MAADGAGERLQRRGPAPIASFDHDVSDESSPETRPQLRLPEIREDGAGPAGTRARSQSTPAAGGLPAPRIDISRASSSSHQDSRDSSPELALFAGAHTEDSHARLELGFREDGALDLRSSTEELAFLEDTLGEPRPTPLPQSLPSQTTRHHSRKDSQSSEVALLAVSGRTSRLSSVGSQCSAHSALSGLSRVSRLSVASGVSRSPSPHRMLLETSFCGPRPIENDSEICAAAVEERLLEVAKLAPVPDSRDRRDVCAEVTVEAPRKPPAPPAPSPAHPVQLVILTSDITTDSPSLIDAPEDDKGRKENKNKERAQEGRMKPKLQRELSELEVYKRRNRTKNIIRIKLKPDTDNEEEEEEIEVLEQKANQTAGPVEHDASNTRAVRPTELLDRGSLSPAPRDTRSPSPSGPAVCRKSSFCSLFKSRETIYSPDSPHEALRRKRSLTEGGGRSKSRDRSGTPTSASKIRGSVLSLFRTPRRSVASPTPGTREGSPVVQLYRPSMSPTPLPQPTERLRYYQDTGDGIIHIPLRTPPEERASPRPENDDKAGVSIAASRREPRPASAPAIRGSPDPIVSTHVPGNQVQHRVLPDGSIIIPLHSPTEKLTFDVVGSVGQESQRILTSPVIATPCAPAQAASPTSSNRVAAEANPVGEHLACTFNGNRTHDCARQQKAEQSVFMTHIGSCDQVFMMQFCMTNTSSITSEMSGPSPSLGGGSSAWVSEEVDLEPACGDADPGLVCAPRDSSESEPSSEVGVPRAGTDVELRRLVVQDSFDEELPYVPTTLPLERSVALPMVPVRDRAELCVTGLQRPRAAAPLRLPAPPTPAVQHTTPTDKLRIRLPQRSHPPTTRTRTRSSGDTSCPPLFTVTDSVVRLIDTTMPGKQSTGTESQANQWIDFEEVPERRKQPKRIEILPGVTDRLADRSASDNAGSSDPPGIMFSYVEPEQCRCECHRDSRATSSPLSFQLSTLGAQDEPSEAASAGTERPSHCDFELDTESRRGAASAARNLTQNKQRGGGGP